MRNLPAPAISSSPFTMVSICVEAPSSNSRPPEATRAPRSILRSISRATCRPRSHIAWSSESDAWRGTSGFSASTPPGDATSMMPSAGSARCSRAS